MDGEREERLEHIHRAIAADEHEQVYRLCDEWLGAEVASAPARAERSEAVERVRLARVVAAVLAGEWEAAVSALEEAWSASTAQQVALLRAYVAYRQNRLDDAHRLCQVAADSVEAKEAPAAFHVRMLQAQIDFRRGDYSAALRTWMAAIDDPTTPATFAAEVHTNALAAAAASAEPARTKQSLQPSTDGNTVLLDRVQSMLVDAPPYELLYNAAFVFDKQGRDDEAWTLLQQAREQAEREAGDDAAADVLQIETQVGCALQHRQQLTEARRRYDHVIERLKRNRCSGGADRAAELVARLNRALLDEDASAILRLDAAAARLTRAQTAAVLQNRALAAIRTRKWSELDDICGELERHGTVDVAVLRACALQAQGKTSEAEKLLVAQQRPEYAAQLALQRQDVATAIRYLQMPQRRSDERPDAPLEPLADRPACVLQRFVLYRSLGEDERALQELQALNVDDVQVLRYLVQVLLDAGRHAEALQTLQRVPEGARGDVRLTAMRVLARSRIDVDAAELEALQCLGSGVEEAAAGVSVEQLLAADAAASKRGAQGAALPASIPKTTSGEGAENQYAARRSKKGNRRGRNPLPPGYDPDAPPPSTDRWLPKHLRPGYKRRRRRGAAADAATANTQGVADLDAGAAAGKAAAPPVNPTVAALLAKGKRPRKKRPGK
ncbi:hypothetical protein CDCA_CDCA08G2337 [Cyanidium caldarium]|uniref:Signal recognition particle subunit SRP72 n=1 Tax=Cyanidium caldarium TaxID=2771 RepID=A0AAV9IVE3_CYACA|nr:hypothetical protein CDCA_CDCA08G2337 [Cyanidium caldarium]